jgi:hypothetical protein
MQAFPRLHSGKRIFPRACRHSKQRTPALEGTSTRQLAGAPLELEECGRASEYRVFGGVLKHHPSIAFRAMLLPLVYWHEARLADHDSNGNS